MRAVYWLPSLFTSLSLLCGFWVIIRMRGEGDYELAALAIVLAAIFDLCDGRVARMANAESAFGRDFDSLADVVSFGLAPAMMAFSWGLHDLKRIGFIACFLYCIAAAARLARFNVSKQTDRRFFNGLPSPMAGVLLATCIAYIGADDEAWKTAVVLAIVVLLAVTMVSNVTYYSFKDINLHAALTPGRLALGLLGFSLLLYFLLEYDVLIILGAAFLYLASGYFFFARNLFRHVKRVRRHGGNAITAVVRKLFFGR